MKKQSCNTLKGAKNIGLTIEKRLHEIGVFSLADLAALTPVKAYKEICEQHPGKTFPVCYYYKGRYLIYIGMIYRQK